MTFQQQTIASKAANTDAAIYHSSNFDPNNCVMMLHGLGDRWYSHYAVAEMLEKADLSWIGLDMPGHGDSGGKRGDIPSVPIAIEIIGEVQRHFSIESFGCYAHSTGGFIALINAKQNPEFRNNLNWLWVNSPLIQPSFGQSSVKIKAAKLLAENIPQLTLPTGVTNSKCCHIELLTDEERANAYANCHSLISTRFGYSLLTHEPILRDGSIQLNCPFLMTHGDDDLICPPPFAFDLYQRVASPHQALIYFDQLRHEPLKEKKISNYLENVRSWITTSVDIVTIDN